MMINAGLIHPTFCKIKSNIDIHTRKSLRCVDVHGNILNHAICGSRLSYKYKNTKENLHNQYKIMIPFFSAYLTRTDDPHQFTKELLQIH